MTSPASFATGCRRQRPKALLGATVGVLWCAFSACPSLLRGFPLTTKQPRTTVHYKGRFAYNYNTTQYDQRNMMQNGKWEDQGKELRTRFPQGTASSPQAGWARRVLRLRPHAAAALFPSRQSGSRLIAGSFHS